MDLTDLLNSIKEMVRPGSSAIQTAPGQTYGPAVSRTTGVPINYRPLDGLGSGQYQNRYTSMLGQMLPGNRGEISIDPTSKDFQQTYGSNSAPVVQHESAHAILEDKFTDPDYKALADKNPAYRPIANKIDRDGYSPAEIPAYMSESGAAQRFNIPQNLVDLYRSHMSQQLQTIDPETATAFTKNMGK